MNLNSSPEAVKVTATRKGFNPPPILLRISHLSKLKMPKNVKMKLTTYRNGL
jgi:hypothetical protein